MSSRSFIDYPESDVEEGEDIVFGGQEVTQRDRELLRIDDEVVEALNMDPGASPKLARFKNFLPGKKKVKFSKLAANNVKGYQPVVQSSSNKPSMDQFGVRDSHDEDYYSDADDIEIDLEMHPIRRRRHNRPFLQKLHLFLFVGFVLLGLVLFSNIVGGQANDHKSSNSNHKDGQSKITRPQVEKPVLSNGTHGFYPTTLVVSLDGFHPHYVNQELTPNLHTLFTQHSAFPYMTPSFPSSTFPNHWTLVTGLYPANHGIVGNTFYDPELEMRFVNTDPAQSLDPRFWGGEPIWKTARLQGVSTAVHMWPGSEVHWKQDFNKPMHVDAFNGTELLENKRDRVFQWLDAADLKDRPELILTYVPDVDTFGHQYGISGPEIRQVLTRVDNLIGEFLEGIQQRNLQEIVNFVVVSDHGMAPTSKERLIYMEDIVNLSKIEHIDGWPLAGLRPFDPADLDGLYNELVSKVPPFKPYQVFRSGNMPKEWHFGSAKYKYADRIADLWIVPKVGWSLTTRADLEKTNGEYRPFGVHGYNNSETLMRALFLASGPSFKDQVYQPIANVDLYNILCYTLGLTPANNDGAPYTQALSPLPKNWVDNAAYPGVDFHTEILKVNSTYDELFVTVNSTGEDEGQQDSRDREGSYDELDTEDPKVPECTTAAQPPTPPQPPTAPESTSSRIYGWLQSVGDKITDKLEGFKDWLKGKVDGTR